MSGRARTTTGPRSAATAHASAPDARAHRTARSRDLRRDGAHHRGVGEHDATARGHAEPRGSLAAAIAGPVIALPHRAQLERAFGRSLTGMPVHADDTAREALAARGAEAAAYRGHILLASPDAPLRTVAHEVAHVLQSTRGDRPAPDVCAPCVAPVPAEVEAETLAIRAERRVAEPGDPMSFVPLQPQVQLAGGVLALRAARAPSGDAMPAPPVRQAPPRTTDGNAARRTNGRGVVGTIPRATPSADGAAATTEAPRGGETAPTGEVTTDSLAGANPAAQSTVSAEQVAAREASMDAARSSVDSADSATGVLDAFAAAPPTLKAQLSGEVGTRLDGALQQERTALDEATPEIAVDIDHGEASAAQGPLVVEAPTPNAVVLEEGTPTTAAGADVESVALDATPDVNADVATAISRIFGGTPAADPASIDAALGDVSTANPGIPTSAGPTPALPLEGANDPGRLDAQSAAGSEHVATGLDAARTAVIDGPGPDVVQPQSMTATMPLGDLPAVAVAPQGAPAGPSEYLALGLPPEAQVAFDEQNAAGMQASLADAQQQAVTATTERDTQHATAVSEAETARDDARATAEHDQQDEVAHARGAIDTERDATLAAQQAEVDRVQGESDARREVDRGAADTRIADDQAQIDDSYAAADRDAQAEVAAGERDADAERAQAERDAENESWFDRAVGWIRDAFNALVSAIGSIFDAVRRAVNAILDAVRDFAIGLINAIATFLQELVAAFGAFLVGLIDTLLGAIFPELAAALTRAVNAAVDFAQRAIGAVADRLRSAVNAIVDALQRGINALLDVFQAALNAVAAVVNAVLTGDWTALLRMAFEAVLRVLGIDPAAAYAFLGRAEETLRLILESPGTFLGNLVSALTGGVEAFGSRFLTHLVNGIIGWLTGALGSAGITIPERFDLLGVLSLVGQVLGLTWQRLRERVVRVIGERAMAVLEFVAGYVETLVTGGFGALWEQITGDLAMLRDMVIGMIRDWLVENVITAAVLRLATMFNPVGALLNIVMTIWNVYTFIRDQLQRLMAVAQAVLGAVSEIAMGVLAPAIATVETTLASLLPLAIDFLARVLGLGNVGGRVREILESVQNTIWGAIDGFIARVRGMFRGGANATPAGAAAPGADASDATARDADDVRTLPMPLPSESHTVTVAFRGGNLAISIASRRQGLLLDVLQDAIVEARERGSSGGGASRREFEALATSLAEARLAATPSALEQDFVSAGSPGYVRREGERIPLYESVAFHVFVERRLTQLVAMLRAAFAGTPLQSLDRLFEEASLAGPRYLPAQCRGGRWIRPNLYEAGRSWSSFRDPIVNDEKREIAARVREARAATDSNVAASIWRELLTAHQVEENMTLATTDAATIAGTAYDLDHVRSTSAHWNTRSGNNMTDDRRQQFYFDTGNLRVVTAQYNRSRAAADENYVPYVDLAFESRLAVARATEIIVNGTTRLPFLDEQNRPIA